MDEVSWLKGFLSSLGFWAGVGLGALFALGLNVVLEVIL